jgi:hypothetical protein
VTDIAIFLLIDRVVMNQLEPMVLDAAIAIFVVHWLDRDDQEDGNDITSQLSLHE